MDYGTDDWPAQPPMSALENSVSNADLFELCRAMPSASVDMILCDLPYGTTACSWDTIIPFDPMWAEFKRVIKPRGAIVLTASQPFTSALVMSNPKMFKYSWVWDKAMPVGHLNAKIMPLRQHEDVMVFGENMPMYFPQMSPRLVRRVDNRTGKTYKGDGKQTYGTYQAISGEYDDYYPRSIVTYSNADQTDKVHPTQKPVDLFRYLIRTYTEVGQVVFDPCVGSGTTAIAARQEGRSFIVGDSSLEYVEIARARLAAPYTPSFMPQLELTA